MGISILLILCGFVCFDANTLHAANLEPAKETEQATISLAEVAPELLWELGTDFIVIHDW